MKIRAGFVSNSSSSSFCVLGIPVEKTAICKILFGDTTYKVRACGHSVKPDMQFCPQCGKKAHEEMEYDDEEIGKVFKERFGDAADYLTYGYDYKRRYIGWNIEGLTFAKLIGKKQAVQALEEIFGDTVQVYSAEYEY